MGLDNSIIIKLKENVDRDMLFDFFDGYVCSEYFDIDSERTEYDVCYFRKYWGLRDEILKHFEYKEDCVFKLSLDDLYIIRDVVINCIKDNTIKASTIWPRSVELRNMSAALGSIQYLIECWESWNIGSCSNNQVEDLFTVEFLDSY